MICLSRTYQLILFAACLAPVAALAQTAEPTPPKERTTSIGFRVRAFPVGSMSSMGDSTAMTTTMSPVYDWQFRTHAPWPTLGIGPAVEIGLGRRATITAEVLYQRLSYDKTTAIFSGGDDPNTANDERTRTTVTENTKARLWDAPVVLHYSVRSHGPWSRMYVAGGGAFRTVSKIRTTHNTIFSNGDTAADSNAATPASRNIFGAVIGVGFRFIDDFNIKSTPEIRFTRWAGRTFDLDTTRSPVNQLEVGIGFTF
jgi:hypothetical protein